MNNRNTLFEKLVADIERATRYKRDLSLFILDLDHFKQVNDTFGHQIGDEILVHVSKLMQDFGRKTDYIGRFGGEEFVIVLPETTLSEAIAIADRLRIEIEESPFERDEGSDPIIITASLGVSSFPQHGTSSDQLMESADKALYVAKKGGRNRVISASGASI